MHFPGFNHDRVSYLKRLLFENSPKSSRFKQSKHAAGIFSSKLTLEKMPRM